MLYSLPDVTSQAGKVMGTNRVRKGGHCEWGHFLERGTGKLLGEIECSLFYTVVINLRTLVKPHQPQHLSVAFDEATPRLINEGHLKMQRGQQSAQGQCWLLSTCQAPGM